jgi:hypothetical protein
MDENTKPADQSTPATFAATGVPSEGISVPADGQVREFTFTGDGPQAVPALAPLPPGPLSVEGVKYRIRSGAGYLAEDPNRSTTWPGFHTVEADGQECLNRTYAPKMVSSLGRAPEHDDEHDPWVAVEVADIATADRLARALLECGLLASIELCVEAA